MVLSLYFLAADSIDLCRTRARAPLPPGSMRVARYFDPLLSSNVRGPVTNGRFGARALPHTTSTSVRIDPFRLLLHMLLIRKLICAISSARGLLRERNIRNPPRPKRDIRNAPEPKHVSFL